MTTVDLFFDIHSYWHVGTGRGLGPSADAVAFRDAAGLPCVPGREVKGLLREAVALAERLGLYGPTPGPAERWFGTAIPEEDRERALERMRYTTLPGALTVGSACLGDSPDATRAWRAWAAQQPAQIAALFRPFASTKLDERGVADDQTLRAVEVVVPVRLRAEVEGPNDDWPDQLARALSFVDGLGAHRNRGFGRVTVTLEKRR